MTARAHTRTSRPAASGVGMRLPWWAVALPVCAFVMLLALLIGGGQEPVTESAALPVAQLLEQIQHTLRS